MSLSRSLSKAYSRPLRGVTSSSVYIQAPDVFATATASTTTEFFNSNTTADPTAAVAYWTCCVGDLQNSGLHYVEYELNGEPSPQSSDAESLIIGVINQTNDRDTTRFDSGWFGGDSDEWGIYGQNGRLYNSGGSGTYLLDPDGTVWTAWNLGDVIGEVLDASNGNVWLGKVIGGVWTPYRKGAGNISDPLTGAHPHFTATGTSFRFAIGDAQSSPDGRATIIPAEDRAL